MIQVIMSASSLTTGSPTAVQVIPSDNKENRSPADNSQRNIVLSKEVYYSVTETLGFLQNQDYLLYVLLLRLLQLVCSYNYQDSLKVVQTLLKRPELNIKGNVTLKRRQVAPTVKPDDPAQLLQRLFQSWNSQNTPDISELLYIPTQLLRYCYYSCSLK